MKLTILLLLLSQVVFSQTIIVEEKTKDTIVITDVKTTYTTKKIVRKSYIAPVIIQPVQSKYLMLPLSGARVISGQSNIVIENLRFENTSVASLIINNSSNIIIRNCFFNKSMAEAIAIEGGSNIRVDSCLFFGVMTGVYAATSKTIKVLNSQFVNVRQRSGPARGQFVQFNNVQGGEVSGNKGENFYEDYSASNIPGASNPEDMISMFGGTSGTAALPLIIKGNTFRGGGPSQSGGGIVAGDHDGSYIRIEGNTLFNPGQYGIAIAGGSNHVITGNKIFSKQFPWSNNPLFIWAQSGSIVCANNVIRSNRAYWINRDGERNGGWNAGNCTNTVWEYPTTITEAEMNVPAHLISFITPDELLKLRGKL